MDVILDFSFTHRFLYAVPHPFTRQFLYAIPLIALQAISPLHPVVMAEFWYGMIPSHCYCCSSLPSAFSASSVFSTLLPRQEILEP